MYKHFLRIFTPSEHLTSQLFTKKKVREMQQLFFKPFDTKKCGRQQMIACFRCVFVYIL